jgi:hypothetical protein
MVGKARNLDRRVSRCILSATRDVPLVVAILFQHEGGIREELRGRK